MFSLVLLFLGARTLAELRLATLYFDLAPPALSSGPGRLFYVVVLRYLYTVGDVACAAALALQIRDYTRLGLGLSLRARDLWLLALLIGAPAAVFVLRGNLGGFLGAHDPTIVPYRMIAVSVGSVIVVLSAALLRLTARMGGGLLARVWGAIGLAGLCRVGSFMLRAAFPPELESEGELCEQILLLGFAGCWWLALRTQLRLATA